jgi:hypothetical protein
VGGYLDFMGMLAALVGNSRPQSIRGLLSTFDACFNELVLKLEAGKKKRVSWTICLWSGGCGLEFSYNKAIAVYENSNIWIAILHTGFDGQHLQAGR